MRRCSLAPCEDPIRVLLVILPMQEIVHPVTQCIKWSHGIRYVSCRAFLQEELQMPQRGLRFVAELSRHDVAEAVSLQTK